MATPSRAIRLPPGGQALYSKAHGVGVWWKPARVERSGPEAGPVHLDVDLLILHRALEGTLEDEVLDALAEAWQAVEESHGDVGRVAGFENGARLVRNARARGSALAAGALARAAPRGREVEGRGVVA